MSGRYCYGFFEWLKLKLKASIKSACYKVKAYLKPKLVYCTRCGSLRSPVIYKDSRKVFGGYSVSCPNCFFSTYAYPTKKSAIRHWRDGQLTYTSSSVNSLRLQPMLYTRRAGSEQWKRVATSDRRKGNGKL